MQGSARKEREMVSAVVKSWAKNAPKNIPKYDKTASLEKNSLRLKTTHGAETGAIHRHTGIMRCTRRECILSPGCNDRTAPAPQPP